VRHGATNEEATTRKERRTMSILMVDFIISLDGYASADVWPGDWGMEGPEYLGWITAEAENEHTASWARRRTG
jgi:hypothetical protein